MVSLKETIALARMTLEENSSEMNIFYLHHNPTVCARSLHDYHVVKMTLETAQILCTVHHASLFRTEIGTREELIAFNPQFYKPLNISHPCVLWVSETTNNYSWTYRLFAALAAEYQHRYGKMHSSWEKLSNAVFPAPYGIVRGPFTLPALAMPDQYLDENPIIAYRRYYIAEKLVDMKGNLYKWTNRRKPIWYPENPYAMCSMRNF